MNETLELSFRGIKIRKRLSIALTVTESEIHRRLSEITCDLAFVAFVALLAADELFRRWLGLGRALPSYKKAKIQEIHVDTDENLVDIGRFKL
jgi:hypothetical protein